MELHSFAERLKFARTQHAKIPQHALADLIGVQQGYISQLEKGSRKSTNYLLEIADSLGVSVRWLASGSGVMVIPNQDDEFEKLKNAVAKFGLSKDEISKVEKIAIEAAQEIFLSK
ncbi:HTH cro/C1-type domain-containing protein [Vibrio chagasii]|uniref:helix-turn-helix domain-containing protein n=1 Tax=Vibrio TaxID=662 RepID=UPI0010531C4C|nr:MULTISPECIES: helix-turn-helix transcriptional regulator [Vibrio]CAH6850060.1 HTH cro/C1-type domain-containing protein [Vibrio chagasii]TCT44328.1 helix-turn-helix protein [Vibrio crassostreae]TKF63450.1 helix-turn-helix transcriptional regulator [Vibrio sp. F13]CAH6861521.1 HTH cro/C1-type domain-containing protein [Vibrio chagasii]CAH6924736.1 HTH cro/C1-type domain-containing protein [Vibrio chagasii]